MLLTKNKWLWIIIVIISTKILCAGTIRHDVDESKYLNHAAKYKTIVKIYGNIKSPKEKNLEISASAVLIKPKWILTAAHVISCSKDQYIVIGEDNKRYDLDLIIIHKDFKENIPVSMNDIAIGRLSSKVEEINEFPILYSDKKEENKICSISGYGMYGNGITGAKTFDSKKRAGTNRIISVNEYMLMCDMTENKKNQTILEFLPAHGDSGGGLFIDGKLAGINSFVTSTDKKPDSNYGDESAHTRISTFKPWIIETIKKHENE